MTTEPADDRARLAALGLIDALRRDDHDALTAALGDLQNEPAHHLKVTTTLASIASGLIDALHNAGMRDLADQLMQTWINPDQRDDTTTRPHDPTPLRRPLPPSPRPDGRRGTGSCRCRATAGSSPQ